MCDVIKYKMEEDKNHQDRLLSDSESETNSGNPNSNDATEPDSHKIQHRYRSEDFNMRAEEMKTPRNMTNHTRHSFSIDSLVAKDYSRASLKRAQNGGFHSSDDIHHPMAPSQKKWREMNTDKETQEHSHKMIIKDESRREEETRNRYFSVSGQRTMHPCDDKNPIRNGKLSPYRTSIAMTQNILERDLYQSRLAPLSPTEHKSLSETAHLKPKSLLVNDNGHCDISPERKDSIMSGLDMSDPSAVRRYRTAFTREQVSCLEKEFHRENYVSRPRRCELAQELGLPETTIKVWFQNRRMKDKRQRMTHTWPMSFNPLCAMLMSQMAGNVPSSPFSLSPYYGHLDGRFGIPMPMNPTSPNALAPRSIMDNSLLPEHRSLSRGSSTSPRDRTCALNGHPTSAVGLGRLAIPQSRLSPTKPQKRQSREEEMRRDKGVDDRSVSNNFGSIRNEYGGHSSLYPNSAQLPLQTQAPYFSMIAAAQRMGHIPNAGTYFPNALNHPSALYAPLGLLPGHAAERNGMNFTHARLPFPHSDPMNPFTHIGGAFHPRPMGSGSLSSTPSPEEGCMNSTTTYTRNSLHRTTTPPKAIKEENVA